MIQQRKVIQSYIYFPMNDGRRTMFNNLVRTICYNQQHYVDENCIIWKYSDIFIDKIIKKHLEIFRNISFFPSQVLIMLAPRDREGQPVEPERIMTSSFVCIRPLVAVGERSFIANHPQKPPYYSMSCLLLKITLLTF